MSKYKKTLTYISDIGYTVEQFLDDYVEYMIKQAETELPEGIIAGKPFAIYEV